MSHIICEYCENLTKTDEISLTPLKDTVDLDTIDIMLESGD